MRRTIAVAACVALLLGPVSRARAATSVPPPEASAVTIPPGRIDRAVASLDRLAAAYLRSTGVPGIAIAVVHGDKVVYAKGFGVREIGTQKKVDADTVFQLASVSKPLGATVMAALVGRGVIAWNEPVAKHLPGFTLADPWVGAHVTLADMYSHRSGLPDHAGDLLEDLGFDRATILERLALMPLAPFRSSYAYTNFGLTAAAQSAANAAGASWEDVSKKVLYAPLGMRSTSSRYADYANAPNHATIHVRVGGKWYARYTREADAESPAGGASSSVSDMAKWMRLELAGGTFAGKRIVDAKALAETFVPHAVSTKPFSLIARASFYGLGMGVGYDEAGRVRWSHSGGFNSGAATTVVMLPSERLGIVVLTNGMAVGIPESIAADFMDLAELGAIQRDWLAGYTPLFSPMYVNKSRLAGKRPPANATPAKANSAYVGKFKSAFYGFATVEARGGGLVLLLGPKREAFPLTHFSGDEFSYLPRGENAVGPSAVTFSFDSGGNANRLEIEFLNDDGLGVFSRVVGAST